MNEHETIKSDFEKHIKNYFVFLINVLNVIHLSLGHHSSLIPFWFKTTSSLSHDSDVNTEAIQKFSMKRS